MSTEYLQLPVELQRALIEKTMPQINISNIAIEKDFWVCWLLQKLFTLPTAKRFAFKGGTSLSKVFNVIQRFSEDVDITTDYRDFDNVDITTASNSQLKKISKQLKATLADFIEESIVPYLQNHIAQLPQTERYTLEYDDEVIRFYYPSIIKRQSPNNSDEYLRYHVLIEFGIRNSTEPSETHTIKPYLADIQTEEALLFPETNVNVLSPLRTFWEKITLMHGECYRARLRNEVPRLARHWYDVAMLDSAGYTESALADLELLKAVIKHKEAFYRASYSHHEEIVNGQLRLLPDEPDLACLHQDYEMMQQSGMFSKVPLPFDELVAQLQQLETRINEKITASHMAHH